MFTGIIQTVGKVTEVHKAESSLVFWMETGFSDLALGESVAIHGICLTVVQLNQTRAAFFVSKETLARSSFANIRIDSTFHLERALRVGDRLSGHWVQGHVDGLARVIADPIPTLGEPSDGSYVAHFRVTADLSPYLVKKGSIAINGVSLTINSVTTLPTGESEISIQLIPYTWEHTDFKRLRAGDSVHVEVDVLAKYAEKMLVFKEAHPAWRP